MPKTPDPLAPILSADQIRDRVAELAIEIEGQTAPDATIHLIAVLKGGFMFLADIARSFSRQVTIDFVRRSSYRDGTEPSGHAVWELEPHDVRGMHVLIVEDIVDTGQTLHALQVQLLAQQPLSLRTVCLLDKPARRRRDVSVDFVGFTIDDVYVVGYGLDYAEQYRQLPYIAALPHR